LNFECKDLNEVWKDIKDYEGYYKISNFGRVKRLLGHYCRYERIIKPYKTKKNYLKIELHCKGIRKKFFIHRLVLGIFSSSQYRTNLQTNHIDGNKLNNWIHNLEWVTAKENTNHAISVLGCVYGKSPLRIKKITKLNFKQVIEIRALLKTGVSLTKIAKQFNITVSNVYAIKIGKTWKDVD